MNIKRAKEEIKHTIDAYHLRGADGKYRIPVIRQRPVLLMGAPGIGKTSIMEQIAAELGTTERAVEGRLYRIKKALRKALGGDDA